MASGNHYVYKKKLGQGAFGCVYLVQKKIENTFCVVKEQYGSKCFKIVRNEVEQLRKMSHPNVISYFGTWEEKNKACIVMEYANGGNLKDFLNRRARPLSENSAMYLFAQIILGVHHIHKQSVLHRDLKPANIMLHGPSHSFVKIADFGIAKNIALENAITRTGTKNYMAPEIFSGGSYDDKCDIWSTGIILYEMLSLKFPFSTKNHVLMLEQITRGSIRALDCDTISPEAQEITYSMLRKSPEGRPRAGHLVLKPIVVCFIKKFYKNFDGPEKDKIFTFLFNNEK